jgi:hypothetical protein
MIGKNVLDQKGTTDMAHIEEGAMILHGIVEITTGTG